MPVEEAPRVPVQNQKTPSKFNWKSALLLFLMGATLIFGGLAAYYYFQLSRNTLTPATKTPKITTTSAKKTAQKTEETKDETADWKVLISKTPESNPDVFDPTATINFSFRYPPGFRKMKDHGHDVVTNDPNYQLGVKTTGSMAILATIGGEKPSSSTEKSLGGKQSLRGINSHGNLISVIYYLDSITTKEDKEVTFSLRCNYIPKEDVDLEKTCDRIASTFNFLD